MLAWHWPRFVSLCFYTYKNVARCSEREPRRVADERQRLHRQHRRVQPQHNEGTYLLRCTVYPSVKRKLFGSRPFWFTKVAVRTCFCLTQFSFKRSTICYLIVGIVVAIYVLVEMYVFHLPPLILLYTVLEDKLEYTTWVKNNFVRKFYYRMWILLQIGKKIETETWTRHWVRLHCSCLQAKMVFFSNMCFLVYLKVNTWGFVNTFYLGSSLHELYSWLGHFIKLNWGWLSQVSIM
jgi:hypothetical protein